MRAPDKAMSQVKYRIGISEGPLIPSRTALRTEAARTAELADCPAAPKFFAA